MNILIPGHPARKKLDEIQAQLAGARAEIAAIEKAPLTLEDQKALLVADIRRKYELADPDQELRKFQRLRADGTRPILTSGGERGAQSSVWDIIALVIDREQLEARLVERLERINAGAQLGLPLAARAEKIKELRAKCAALERGEEHEILHLEGDRWIIARRGDADVDLLLEIWAAWRPQAAAASAPLETDSVS